MDKQEVLQAIGELAAGKQISENEVLHAYRSGTGKEEHQLTITKVLYAIGGIIVAAGIIFLLAQMWDTFGAASQILVTLGSAIALYIAAVLLHQQDRFRAIASVFFVIAAVIMPIGIFVTLHHLSSTGDVWMGQLIMSVIPAAVYLVSYYLFRNPILFFIGILLATWSLYAVVGIMLDNSQTSFSFAQRVWAYMTLITGSSYVLLGSALSSGDKEKLVGALYFLGSAATLGAGFALTFLQEPWVLIYFLLILAAIYFSTVLRSRSLLVLGAFGLIGHLTHISFEYFADSLGFPLALIISGFVVIGVGYGTISLHKRFISKAAS